MDGQVGIRVCSQSTLNLDVRENDVFDRMKLLRELHTRYLISSRLLCAWLADSLATANLAQTGFISQLIGDYLPDMARHVTIGRQCVRSICAKLKEVSCGSTFSIQLPTD
jgi:hypothetical protein